MASQKIVREFDFMSISAHFQLYQFHLDRGKISTRLKEKILPESNYNFFIPLEMLGRVLTLIDVPVFHITDYNKNNLNSQIFIYNSSGPCN